MVSPLLLEPTHVLAVQRGERAEWARDLGAVRAHRARRAASVRHALLVTQAAAATLALAVVTAARRPAATGQTSELCCTA